MKNFAVYFKDDRLNEELMTEQEAIELINYLGDRGIKDLYLVDTTAVINEC